LLLVRDVWSECPARTEPYGESAVGTPRRGLDVYDPTTGEIRSGTTDELCKKLQRALKAEIDEAAWSTLYSTVSRPFDPPSTGRIAVKVINHYGDEVLKVYEIGYAEP
jgi:adenine-specific DNA-methyltransferase